MSPIPALSSQIPLAEGLISVGDYVVMASLSGNSGSRRFVLLVCFFTGAILTFQAIRIWVADYRVHSNQIDQMERGAALEPENAAAWDRLGRARETNLENLDPAGAVADFQKAVARVPVSPAYWMDLANGYEAIGNVPLAREAFTRARASYPASAVVAWGYGNFLLWQNDFGAGFAQIKQALQADSKLVPLAVSRVWHLNQNADLHLNQVLPANQDAYFQAIDFMQDNRQPAAALVIWQQLLSLGKPFELRRSFPLLELLIQSDRAEGASRVWREALTAAGLPHNCTTAPVTHFLSIQLRRSPSRLFENKLGGTAWIGDVSLVASNGAGQPQAK